MNFTVRKFFEFIFAFFTFQNCYYSPIIQSLVAPTLEQANANVSSLLGLSLLNPSGSTTSTVSNLATLSLSGKISESQGVGSFSGANLTVERQSSSIVSSSSIRNTQTTQTQLDAQGNFRILTIGGTYRLRIVSTTGQELGILSITVTEDGKAPIVSVSSGNLVISDLVFSSLSNQFTSISGISVQYPSATTTTTTGTAATTTTASSGSATAGTSATSGSTTTTSPTLFASIQGGRSFVILNQNFFLDINVSNNSSDGEYTIRKNFATGDCSTGTQIANGIYSATGTTAQIQKSEVSVGLQKILVCVTIGSLTLNREVSYTGDGTPPSFVSSLPESSQTDVNESTSITITFNEPILAGSTAKFEVNDTNGPISGSVAISGNSLIFTPSTVFPFSERISVGVSGYTDRAGNPQPMSPPVDFYFDVRSPP